MARYLQKVSFIIVPLLIISVFIFLLTHIYRCIKADIETNVISEEIITEAIDVADIKHRMKYHGCLACWKDSAGVWWFYRDGEQCKLRPPK